MQEIIDNVKGKNNVGFLVWFFSLWNLIGILLSIPFFIMMYIMIALPMALILEPKNTIVSLADYIKNKLGIEANTDKKTIADNHTSPQESQKQQSTNQKKTLTEKHTVNDDCEVDDEINEETKNHQENMVFYSLLWIAIIFGFIVQFFIKPTYQFSTTTFGVIWLIGFIISIYLIFATKQRFRDYNLLFVVMAPSAIIFWLSVVSSFVANKDNENKELKIQDSTAIVNKAINEVQLKGVENFSQTKLFENSVKANQELLGDNPSDEKIISHLKKVADITNNSLPMMVDEDTQMFKINVIGKTIIYNYNVMNIGSFININNNIAQEFKDDMMGRNTCAIMGHIIKYGVTLSYNYYAANGDYLFTVDITPQDCGY